MRARGEKHFVYSTLHVQQFVLNVQIEILVQYLSWCVIFRYFVWKKKFVLKTIVNSVLEMKRKKKIEFITDHHIQQIIEG